MNALIRNFLELGQSRPVVALAIILCSMGTLTQGQPGAAAWVRTHYGLAESNDRGQKVLVDAAGNVIVAGSSDIGIEGLNGSDWLVIKYSNAGVPLWTNLYSGPGDSVDGANSVVEDANGDLIVTGYSHERSFERREFVTIKYSGAGQPLWTNRHAGSYGFGFLLPPFFGNGAAVDGVGNVFVTTGNATVGYSSAGALLWTNLYPAARPTGLAVDGSGNIIVTGHEASYSDYVTVKYSPTGQGLWTNRHVVCGYGSNYAIAVDGAGNAFVAGSTDCSGSAILAYSSAGMPLWTNRFADGYWDDAPSAAGLTVDGSGNLFVAGTSRGSRASDFVIAAYSNTGVLLWTNRYHGPGKGEDSAAALAVDSAGNLLVTGSSLGSGGYRDYATIKYSPAGVALWTNRFAGPGDSQARSVAVDQNGNLFVNGWSWNGISDDLVTIKYSGAGMPLWTNRYNRLGDADDHVAALAASGSGNLFVTGSSTAGGASAWLTLAYSSSGLPLWTNRHAASGLSTESAAAAAVDSAGNVLVTGTSSLRSNVFASSDFSTIRYSSAGVPLWTNRYDGPGRHHDEAVAVAADASGNAFVTGGSTGNDGRHSYATIKYSNTGAPLWTNRYGSSTHIDDRPVAMLVDGSGDVVVTGASYGGLRGPDYATIKYSGAGAFMWANRYNGPVDNSDFPSAMAADGAGNIFVTGSSFDGSSYDCVTIKYSSTGAPLWTNRYNGSGRRDDTGNALATDSSGNAIVAGYSYESGRLGDFLAIKFSSEGVPLWTNLFNGPGNSGDGAVSVAVDSAGSVFVTGNSSGPNGSPETDLVTIKYSSAGVALWTNRYSGPGNATDLARAVATDRGGNALVTGKSWNGSSYDFVMIKYSSTGTPMLTIVRQAPKKVAVSWPSPSTGFTLQQSTNGVAPPNWSTVAASPTDDQTTRSVVLDASAGSAFYRLVQPQGSGE